MFLFVNHIAITTTTTTIKDNMKVFIGGVHSAVCSALLALKTACKSFISKGKMVIMAKKFILALAEKKRGKVQLCVCDVLRGSHSQGVCSRRESRANPQPQGPSVVSSYPPPPPPPLVPLGQTTHPLPPIYSQRNRVGEPHYVGSSGSSTVYRVVGPYRVKGLAFEIYRESSESTPGLLGCPCANTCRAEHTSQ